MQDHGFAAYVVPSSDPHQSEYPPERWRTRSWLSGFEGSAGTLVVTLTEAGLWVDSRYYLAAEEAIAGTGITLHKHGLPTVADYPAWLATSIERGSVVSFDAAVVALSVERGLRSALLPAGIEVSPGPDLPGEIWSDRPSLPSKPVFEHPVKYAGASRGEKLSRVREAITEQRATVQVVSALDEIAWLLNLRGSDVAYNPVFLAYLIVDVETAALFVDEAKLSAELRSSLERDGVNVRPYGELRRAIDALGERDRVLVAPTQTSVELAGAIAERSATVEAASPIAEMKGRKNAVEIECLRKTMVRDGVAMCRFLAWLERSVKDGSETELTAETELNRLRAEGENFVSEAFRTISAYRGHAALPHYSVTSQSNALLESAGIYLVDSGGQYTDGTTDITRTITLGEPAVDEVRDFTLVLKAHIALATVRFPRRTTGLALDAITRKPIWDAELNYGHGTGHGVGFFLNVHEGPQKISEKGSLVEIEPGMLTSNEPGLYRPGRHGIRTENLIVAVEAESNEFDQFLEFETVTLCPIDTRLVDLSLLTSNEIEWLNGYHRRVRDALLGHLDAADAEWLEERCAAVEIPT